MNEKIYDQKHYSLNRLAWMCYSDKIWPSNCPYLNIFILFVNVQWGPDGLLPRPAIINNNF